MPSTFSKLSLKVAAKLPPEWILFYIRMSKAQKFGFVSLVVGFVALLKQLYFGKWKQHRQDYRNGGTCTKKRVGINKEFLDQMRHLLKVMIPGVWTNQVGILAAHSVALVARTFLSIYVAKLEGKIVSQIVQRNTWKFVRLLMKWMLIAAVPACICNSSIKFLERHLALSLRSSLVKKAYTMYFDNQVYYKIGNLDKRVPNPDHSLTEDISQLAYTVAHLYSHITKPLLDCLMIVWTLRQRARSVHANSFIGPAIALSVISVTGQILKAISPNFGHLVAKEADMKASLRHKHSRIVTNSEEIAFYGGAEVEKQVVTESYRKECQQSRKIYLAKLWYVFIEHFLMKYFWSGTGMVLTAIPILTARDLRDGHEAQRTEYYMTTKNLLLGASDAIERLMSSYKEIIELAGYASRVSNIFKVFDEVSKGKYVREMCTDKELQLGNVTENNDGLIELQNITVVTPAGDIIVPSLDLCIKPGMNLLITGPNGCGKSSIFRILSGLWPVYNGNMSRPPIDSLFYIPQRPYMSLGSLREQVIYPNTKKDMERKKLTDKHLVEILEKVRLNHIVTREGGWDAVRDWQDVLSGGEKQRIGIARLFYHRPKFALLDECTSAVSMDVEDSLYSMMKENGITLLTISHRPSLFKHHSHILKFNGDGAWAFDSMDRREV